MRFFFSFVILAVVGLTLNGFSQDYKKTGGLARLTSMGANVYVADPFFVTINPAWNSVYDDFLMGDLGSNPGTPFSAGGNGQYISANFRLDRNWTIGGILTRNDFNGFSIAQLDPWGNSNNSGLLLTGVTTRVNDIVGTNSVVPLDNNVELIGTFSFGNSAVGLGIAYAGTTRDFIPDNGPGYKGSASQIGLNLGLLAKASNNFTVDLGASLMLPKAKFDQDEVPETNADQTIIFANARVFWKQSSKFTVVPVIAFATASGSFETAGTSYDDKSLTSISAGLGINYTVGDFLLAGGLMYSTNSVTTPEDTTTGSETPELTTTYTNFPVWNIGLEWNMLEWFVARLGYAAVTGSVTREAAGGGNDVDEYVQTYFLPPTRGFTIGVGFRLGDFSLDATVNEDVLRQGFNNIGGGGSTFAYLSTSYALP